MAKLVTKQMKSKWVAAKYGFKSGLEEIVSNQIAGNGIDVKYESEKLIYTIPATQHTYTPDFILPNGIIIETKGRFVIADRKKHILIKEQHPELDIRFIFTNSRNKLNKSSKTTYADWCNKNGFIYADKLIPQDWF
jgi:hypothetical protein